MKLKNLLLGGGMRNLKINNKVAAADGIHPDLIKYGGNKLLNRN